MTTGNEQWLREGLSTLSEQYHVVDLRDRTLETSRRLGVRRAAVGAALAAVLVLGGAGAAVALGRPNAAPPRPPGGTVTTAVPEPTPDSTEPPPQGPPVTIPPGAIDLTNATLDLPSFTGDTFDPCQGRQTFARNIADPPADDIGFLASVAAEWAGDVNRDGAIDTVALITCEMSETYQWQLTAFDGTASAVRTIGRVVAINSQPNLHIVFGGQVLGDGSIRLEVGDFTGIVAGHAEEVSTHQTRTYRWNGSAFAQTAGPTTFPPNPNFVDLRATTTGLVLGKPSNGFRNGTLRMTVTNVGSVLAESVTLDVVLPAWLERLPPESNCPHGETADGVQRFPCGTSGLEPGTSTTYILSFRAPVSADSLPTGMASFTAHGQAMIFGTAFGQDARPNDDTATIRITRS